METILRSEEMAEIARICLIPVRHHSPACAFHVKKVIGEWKPDAVLVEGPDNANAMIPVMVHGDTRAPFAIYYAYHDKAGKISGQQEHYKCYYPFLDYSPELVALREAHRNMTCVSFIDLSYGDILYASHVNCREGQERNGNPESTETYNDDYLLTRNAYITRLCEKTGMRSFDEFWEKYFELNGMDEDSDVWFSHLNTYCALARENTPETELEMEGCLARERHMAARIVQKVQEGCRRVLVVTGGFHTPGLRELLSAEKWQETAAYAKSIGQYVPHEDESVYLMPYTMEAADALNGYASGMPYTGFYQKIWDGIASQVQKPYEEAVLDMLVSSGKELRKQEGYLSTYDEICAWQMAQGLCSLRGKPQPGAYELQDAVLSSYVKGEYNIASDMPVRILRQLMTGTGSGALCTQADVPPIVLDFEKQCSQFGIKTNTTLEKEVVFSIFSSKKHRQMSMFFHRLVFLKTPFAVRVKGPDLQRRVDRNLVREVWKYKYHAQVYAALIDVSVYGATVEDAVMGIVEERLGRDIGADSAALLLTQVFEMGMESQLDKVYGAVQDAILQDADFYSVADALKSLLMMEELGVLYESRMEFGALLRQGVRKLLTLLSGIARIRDEKLDESMEALKLLYRITGRKDYETEREDFFEVLERMQGDTQIHAGLNGCIHGILYGGGRESAHEVGMVCKGYLTGTREQLLQTAVFFRGLFFAARDLLLIEKELLGMMDSFLGEVSEDEFMELLPQLRMAFAYFTPSETDKIAGRAAAFHQKRREDIMEREEILPEWFSYGKRLDAYVWDRMSRAYPEG